MNLVRHDIPQPNNFNMIRLLLAFCVFCVHFVELSDLNTNLRIISGPDCVRSFFVISGFLIYSSYCKSSSLKSYFIKRARRILPSYILVILFFAFGLFFVSTCSVSEYFGGDWLKYIVSNLSFANYIQPTLPGVFVDNNIEAVNGSLWTIKIELMCYIALPILVYLCKKLKINPLIFFGIIIVLSMVYSAICNILLDTTGNEKYAIYGRQILGQLAYFVFGMLLYRILPLVIKNKYKLLIIGVIVYCATQLVLSPILCFIKPIAIALTIIPLAFVGHWGKWLKATDISYDLYLIHFPVVQLFAHFHATEHMGIFPAFIVVTITVIVLSLLSWHFIGKRFLHRVGK